MKRTIFAVIAACVVAGPALASPCGNRIAALEKRFENSGGDPEAAKPDLQGTAPESTSATMHRQPTAGSVAAAEQSADSPAAVRGAKFQVMIEQARAADNANDATECEASATEAEKQLR